MCNIQKTLEAYREWALDNKSKCSPKLYALYTELALKAHEQERAVILVNPKEFNEVIGVKEPRAVIDCLDELADAGLIFWNYRSTNGKKAHELCLLTFKRDDILDEELSHPRLIQDSSKLHPRLIQAASNEIPPRTHVDTPAPGLVNNYFLEENKKSESAVENAGEDLFDGMLPLAQQVEQFKTDNPSYYPEVFYQRFVDYFSGACSTVPGNQKWHSISKSAGRWILKNRLEESWRTSNQRYPGWVQGSGYTAPEAEQQAIAQKRYTATSSSIPEPCSISYADLMKEKSPEELTIEEHRIAFPPFAKLPLQEQYRIKGMEYKPPYR